MPSEIEQLVERLRQMDGRSYKAYKDIRGRYVGDRFTLRIDHVQGDPFGTPSAVRIELPLEVAQLPADTFRSSLCRIALCDYLTRRFVQAAADQRRPGGTGNSGAVEMDRPGQEVLERTSVNIRGECIEARFRVGLPARGRRILGTAAAELIGSCLDQLVERALLYRHMVPEEVQRHVETVEDTEALRAQLTEHGLVAFVGEGAVLPRRSGIDQRPLTGGVPFSLPDSLHVTLERPNGGPIRGMGIPAGVTLIVGGGYHGKTTLLEAIERGVYNHVPGDGREWVVAQPDTVKVRAEDGRSVHAVNISPFINQLPGGISTERFSTANASGSTSQAAAIIEAVEAGARVLLMDEDTSATNFMIRDQRMQHLVAKRLEPITPYVDKVRQLATNHQVSTILVVGGSGDYFDQADTVVAMQQYRPRDATAAAHEVARRFPSGRQPEGGERFGTIGTRVVPIDQIVWQPPNRPAKVKAPSPQVLRVGNVTIDLAGVAQLVDASQTRAIGRALVWLASRPAQQPRSLAELLDELEEAVARGGLDVLTEFPASDLARFRRYELAAAINRLRDLPET